MNNIAIIPARGGSKRIPRKNIKDFLGKPIIAYSIEVALQSGLFCEVMVSTDDKEIAEIAKKFGAKVPFFRSDETSNDFSTTMQVIHEVIETYHKIQKRGFDYLCCIYPTAPFIKTEYLKLGFDLLRNNKYNSVIPIVPFGYPIWRGLIISEEGKTEMIYPEYQNIRSQDLKNVYHDAGQWYWLDLKKTNDSIFTNNTGSIVLSEKEVQDIDILSDWELAEIKFKLNHEI